LAVVEKSSLDVAGSKFTVGTIRLLHVCLSQVAVVPYGPCEIAPTQLCHKKLCSGDVLVGQVQTLAVDGRQINPLFHGFKKSLFNGAVRMVDFFSIDVIKRGHGICVFG